MGKYLDKLYQELVGKKVVRLEERFTEGLWVWFEDGGYLVIRSAMKMCPFCHTVLDDTDVDYEYFIDEGEALGGAA